MGNAYSIMLCVDWFDGECRLRDCVRHPSLALPQSLWYASVCVLSVGEANVVILKATKGNYRWKRRCTRWSSGSGPKLHGNLDVAESAELLHLP